jgi:hypothetical protein
MTNWKNRLKVPDDMTKLACHNIFMETDKVFRALHPSVSLILELSTSPYLSLSLSLSLHLSYSVVLLLFLLCFLFPSQRSWRLALRSVGRSRKLQLSFHARYPSISLITDDLRNGGLVTITVMNSESQQAQIS